MRGTRHTIQILVRSIACFIALVCLAHTGFAQGTITISGTVTDSKGGALAGATVKALNIASGRETTVQADGTGKYQLSGLTPGGYRVTAVVEGFGVEAVSITLSSPATQDFSLSPGAIEDVVTVTAGKGSARVASDIPQTVTVATAQDLEQRRPGSAFQALERSPSLIVRETNPARERPRLRGLDSSRILIVIDGERLNNVRTDLNTGLSPGILDPTQLQSAEVVAGAGSSLYGSDSLGGTVNFVTKPPTRADKGHILGIRFDGTYITNGSNRRGAVAVNYSNTKFAARLSGGLFRLANYDMGNSPITLEQNLRIGNFYTQLPGGQTAANWPVFELPKNAEILNGQAHGFNDAIDLWYFPSQKHSLRYKQLNSQHYDLGDAFSGPPYETQDRFNLFRRLDKYGARYEGTDLAPWLPRIAGGLYRQKLSFPQTQFDNAILAGSSFNTVTTPPPSRNVFTGNPSRFSRTSFTDNKNSTTSYGADVQVTLAPFAGAFITTGYQYLRDDSRDEFFRVAIANGQFNPATRVLGASSPNTKYTNNAFFIQGEWDRVKWVRLSGGVRVDNWRTNAEPTTGYPLGAEFAILNAAIPGLTANPGALAPQVASLPTLASLAAGQGAVRTSSTPVTGNVGAVFRFNGFNPYIRYATSYREPSITERYLLRNFTPGIPLSSLVVGNPNLSPERGKNLDVGIKIQKRNFSGSFAYFRNKLDNLIVFALPGSALILVNADPARGLIGSPAFGGRHPISFNGRINQAESLIQGIEATYDLSIPIGRLGSITPFGSMSYLKGTNQSPDPQRLSIIQNFYNRIDSPIELKGRADDVPLGNITPFRGIFGATYTDPKGKFFVEYSVRHQSKVTRVDPNALVGSTLVNIGTYLSLNSFTKQTLKGGYTYKGENFRASFTVGVDNLSDRLFFEHFQNSPAPGRAFVFGVTTEFMNILKK